MIKRLLIVAAVLFYTGIMIPACGQRSTSISVTDPRTGAVNTLEHESDTRNCAEEKNCEDEN